MVERLTPEQIADRIAIVGTRDSFVGGYRAYLTALRDAGFVVVHPDAETFEPCELPDGIYVEESYEKGWNDCLSAVFGDGS